MVTLWSHFSSHSSHFSNTQDVTRSHKMSQDLTRSHKMSQMQYVLQCPQRNHTILDSFNTDLFDLFAFKESRSNLIAWQKTELQTANSAMAIHSSIHSALCLDCNFGKGFGKPGSNMSNMTNQPVRMVQRTLQNPQAGHLHTCTPVPFFNSSMFSLK